MLQVGNTPLLKIKELCTLFNLPNLFIKDESKNPFGTVKDRRTSFIVKNAVESNVDKLVLITSGNAGYSLGNFCEGTNVRLVNVINKTTNSSIKKKLKECSIVVEKDLSQKISSEELINLAGEKPNEVVWDVCAGFLDAYESLFNEIMTVNPSIIILSVGSGNTFVSLYNS
ncbi:PLP-dependent lyase/thiolase, partial [Candidatus Woesearchaeota archaeon]|nr:PLP-dependent lyase/thiolase [Candidatus Woesearchaeota archaeon]